MVPSVQFFMLWVFLGVGAWCWDAAFPAAADATVGAPGLDGLDPAAVGNAEDGDFDGASEGGDCRKLKQTRIMRARRFLLNPLTVEDLFFTTLGTRLPVRMLRRLLRDDGGHPFGKRRAGGAKEDPLANTFLDAASPLPSASPHLQALLELSQLLHGPDGDAWATFRECCHLPDGSLGPNEEVARARLLGKGRMALLSSYCSIWWRFFVHYNVDYPQALFPVADDRLEL